MIRKSTKFQNYGKKINKIWILGLENKRMKLEELENNLKIMVRKKIKKNKKIGTKKK